MPLNLCSRCTQLCTLFLMLKEELKSVIAVQARYRSLCDNHLLVVLPLKELQHLQIKAFCTRTLRDPVHLFKHLQHIFLSTSIK